MAQRFRKKPLTIERVLAWADAHLARTGRWPSQWSGRIHGARRENWANVNDLLRRGGRGQPGGSSLSRLLAQRRGRLPGGPKRSKLTIDQILAWANAHHRRTGRWPSTNSGSIPGAPGESWSAIQNVLYFGMRGLPGRSSLSQLLQKHFGQSAGHSQSKLSVRQILEWADIHHRRAKSWPTRNSGDVIGTPGEKWSTIYNALYRGHRGLNGGTTLDELLWRRRGVISQGHRPKLTLDQILKWADAYHKQTSKWPTENAGPIAGSDGLTWSFVKRTLCMARHGLPGGWTLKRLLVERRGAAVGGRRSRLTRKCILTWADNHHRRTGVWPNSGSGPLLDVPGEKWSAIDYALRQDLRGLQGDESLARLLARYRGISPNARRPFLTVAAILNWADAHRRRTKSWPTSTSGAIPGAPGEMWAYVAAALRSGGRGLPKGLTLQGLLAKHRNAPPRADRRPCLTVKQIMAWVKSYHRRTGEWPRVVEEPILGAPGETWRRLDYALRKGRRGLPGGMKLKEFVAQYCRGQVTKRGRPRGSTHGADRGGKTRLALEAL